MADTLLKQRDTQIAENVTNLIGNTPMVYLSKKVNDTHARIALKLESMNPLASVKDRLALAIIEGAERDGIITPGKSTLVEATSGNTGIAVAQFGAVRGYKVVLTMPETMSQERRTLLGIFGAQLILTPGALGAKGAVVYAKKYVADTPDTFDCDQFASRYNAPIHKDTTGEEIWTQTGGKLDYVVAGVGTGGTLTGIAQCLKEKGSAAKVVAVEPAESSVLSGEKPGPHKIQGLGAGFVPSVLDTDLMSEVIPVKGADAMAMGRVLPRTDGLFVGISSGAAVHAALEVARRPEAKDKLIVAVIPSFGERYLSTDLFKDIQAEAAQLPVKSVEEVKKLME